MALTDILKKIEKEANKKSAFMKQVANDEIKKIQKEAKEKAVVNKSKIEEKVETQCAAVIKKSKTLAVMEGRSVTLKQKREVIDQTYEEVEKDINTLGDDDYLKLMTEMIKHAMKSVENGHLTVPVARRKQTEEAIRKVGADYHIKSETNDFKGGFVLTSGKVEINLSFSYLVQRIVRPATELEVAKILFS